MLSKSNSEHANLTYCEFLLTHNVKRGVGEIYSFREMPTLVVLEPRYCKVLDWTNKFFLSSWGWEFSIGQVGWAKFPISAFYRVTKNPLLIHSEVLLGEDSLNAFLPPIAYVTPSARGIVIHPPLESSRK